MNTDKPSDAVLTPEKTVADVMNTDVVTVQLNDVLPIANDMKYLRDAGCFPVLDRGKLAGIVDPCDLLNIMLVARSNHSNEPLRGVLSTVTVRKLMKAAATVSPETSISQAARTMVERGVECLLVTVRDELIGLVTKANLLRELANDRAR
jgi:CBS domain-containing protein